MKRFDRNGVERDGYHVYAGDGKSGVNDDLFPGLGIPNKEHCFPVLFGDQGRGIGLETSSAETHDDKSDNEAGKRSIGVLNDTRDGGDDEEDMAEECDCDRDANRLVATPVGVGNISAEKGDNVNPKSRC